MDSSKRRKLVLGTLGTLFCGLAGAALADSATPDVQAQIDSLKATVQQQAQQINQQNQEINQLKGQQTQTWLNEQRAEEVKALVRDVLADADTRASLMSNGMTAGHNGSNFFLASENGDYLLRIGGQIQVRYDFNMRSQNSGGSNTAAAENASNVPDGDESGFNIHRAKITFDGYVGNPKIDYKFQLAADRNTTNVDLEDAWLAYSVTDEVRVWGGRFHDTFAREALMSSRYQQTASRSLVEYVYASNDDYVDGAGVEWKVLPDYVIWSTNVNNGLSSGSVGSSGTGVQTGFQNNGGHDYFNTATEFAISSRLDFKILGDWKNMSDVESWTDVDSPQLYAGLATHYELAKSGDNQSSGNFTLISPSGAKTIYPYDSFVQWTADALFKQAGFSLMGAVYGWQFFDASSVSSTLGVNPPSSTGAAVAKTPVVGPGFNNFAATVQAGYFVIPDKFEPFLRWEWLMPDDTFQSNDLNLVAGGFNYFFRKHAVKFTTDVTYAFNNINSANTFGQSITGTGLLLDDPGSRGGQISVRSQVQLLF